ncbi:CPBP family intramembrane metalloprotease [Cohnella sp. CFH 77786]|uniref:CPBP family intramembrane glutamic endopeptidase n=1 Tax=Cohnella sp. CFH 77786 TaxID=2662265 RepID=UPI001C60CE24|nr:CPBP family intramembrane glutamic endopeptidase [Cohnella sp. CFH 77786]MBW5447309.1 CPBP family intramembrane metalloprotease [Cohnella sp. CFH 77786]
MSPLWVWAAGIGFVVFLVIQVFPIFWGSDAGEGRAISREEAERAARSVAETRFGISGDQIGSGIEITHMSNSGAVGYFSKTELLERYKQTWSQHHPTDVYRADLLLGGDSGTLTLYLQMETGKLVGWQDDRRIARPDTGGKQANAGGENSKQEAERALSYAAVWGERAEDWEWDGKPSGTDGTMTFLFRHGDLEEARLALKVRVPAGYNPLSSAPPPWKNGLVSYEIRVPESFAAYLTDQKRLAGMLNAFGFVIPQLTLLILAIVYSVSHREYTSFRRGIGLSFVFLVLYSAFYLNMIPGFRAGLLDEGLSGDSDSVTSILAVNFVILAGMAMFTYFAAVGGDGLWRSMGKPLWPSWREAGFGEAVLGGMKTGYPLALLLLGVQSVILVGLEQGIGMFQSSDASQSAYNMTLPWLLLLLAWCAGISEELQSRLFGIGLFRSWLVGGAARLLGRKPSRRAESALTVLAMIPPGLFWAFGHVGYAVYPAYSRLIELVIMALLFGWFLLRFGLIAVLFAHIVLDSVLMSVQILSDGLPGHWAAGLLGLVLPATVAYALRWAHGLWGGGRRMVHPPK